MKKQAMLLLAVSVSLLALVGCAGEQSAPTGTAIKVADKVSVWTCQALC